MVEDSLYEGLKTVCARRRSVRRFSDRAPSAEQVERIRDLALLSPFASARKCWDVRVVTDRDLVRDLAVAVDSASQEIAARVRDDFRPLFLDYATRFTHFEGAPVLFLPVFRLQRSLSLMIDPPDEEIERFERDNFMKSISCAAMLVLLAAESLGLGACFMTGPLVAEEALRKRLGLKDGFAIGAVIPVGYPGEEAVRAENDAKEGDAWNGS